MSSFNDLARERVAFEGMWDSPHASTFRIVIERRWEFPPSPTFRLVLDGVPKSKKNGQKILRGRGGRPIVKQSGESEQFEARIRRLAKRAIGENGLGDRYVAVRIVVDEGTKESPAKRTAIEIYDLGPQPTRGRTDTQRDIHNCADSVMDALNKIAWDDDRQGRMVLCEHGRVVVCESDHHAD